MSDGGAGAALIGGIFSSAEAKRTARANIEAAREMNEANYRLFRESRGSEGNAVLPLYFGGGEKELSNDAMNYYRQTQNLLGTPQAQLARYRQAMDVYRPAMEAGAGALNDVYNGNMTASRLGYLQPVAAARTAAAKTAKQGVLQGLRERTSALNADSARKGYTGSGSFAQNRLLASTIGGRQAAAGVESAANLANAEDVRRVYDEGMNNRLAYLQMPYNLAQSNLALALAPENEVAQNFTRSLAPFQFFRMGPQTYQNSPLPQMPNIPGIGQMAATALGGASNNAGEYFRQLARANSYSQPMAYDIPGGYSSLGYGTTGWGDGGGGFMGADAAYLDANMAFA